MFLLLGLLKKILYFCSYSRAVFLLLHQQLNEMLNWTKQQQVLFEHWATVREFPYQQCVAAPVPDVTCYL